MLFVIRSSMRQEDRQDGGFCFCGRGGPDRRAGEDQGFELLNAGRDITANKIRLLLVMAHRMALPTINLKTHCLMLGSLE